MRQFLLLTASLSVLTLAGCTALTKGKPETAEPATTASSTDIKTSDKEQQEMAGVMGGDAPEVNIEDKEIPPPPVADLADAEADATQTAETTTLADSGDKKTAPAGAPTDCPAVEVLPDTKSITYFDDPEGKPSGAMVASAALVDIRGGCDYAEHSVSVDIDMIMKGKITDKGRYEGRDDLEAFMTFPYFVAIMGPDGKMIDKKILATAMRFKPKIDELDHAEKITQTIPLPDIAQGPKYTITLGFQLNRVQLDYNRGGSTETRDNIKKSEGKKKAPVKEPTKAEKKAEADAEVEAKAQAEAKPVEAPAPVAETTAPTTPSAATPAPAAIAAPAPQKAASAPSKMKPIYE